MKRKTTNSIKLLAAILLTIVMASSCANRSIIRKINWAVADLKNVTVTTDDHLSRVVDCVYGFGSRFVMLDAVSQERMQAFGFLSGSSMVGLTEEDERGPYFSPAEEGKPGNLYRNQYLSMIIDAGADINTGFVVPSGNERTIDIFVRRAVFLLDPAQIAYNSEPLEGIDGNQLGWTLMMLADVDMVTAEWSLPDGRKTGTADFVQIAMNRPLEWGAYNGLIEQQGIAAALHAYKLNSLIEETSYYDAQKKANNGNAVGDSPLYDSIKPTGFWGDVNNHVGDVLKLLEKNRNDDGTFSRQWSVEKKAEDKELDVILYSSLALEIISEGASDEQIAAPWVRTSVVRLSNLVSENRFELHDNSLVMSHAARSLRMYRERLMKSNKPLSIEAEFSETVEPYDDANKEK